MATTTNFGWETPDDTDLVKDGAAAMRTLGNAIDTSLVDLKGGTTGQVLAKASNTDMDFTWATDASGIPATIFDAKGDLIAASAADTAARLAVGTNGQVLTANSAQATGLEWTTISSGGMTLIGTYSPNNTSATLSITSIPSTYKHLLLVGTSLQSAQAGSSLERWDLGFNSNTTGSNYHFYGVKSEANSALNTISNAGAGSAKYFIQASQTSGGVNTYGATAIWIYDYTSTSQKAVTINSHHGDTSAGTSQSLILGTGKYLEAAAISSIQIKDTDNSANLKAGTFKLYGVS